MKFLKVIMLFALFIAMFSPAESKAQFDQRRLIARLTDFGAITFEQQSPIKDRQFFTQGVYFNFDRNIQQTRTFSEGAVRFGYENHRLWTKRISYFWGSDVGLGYDLTDTPANSDLQFNLYAALGFEGGVNFSLGKRFEIGVQSGFWIKYSMPVNELGDAENFEFGLGGDADWLSFNFIYKLQNKKKVD